MDIAELGYKVETKPLKDASKELGNLNKASKRTQAANDNVNKSFNKTAVSSKKLATSVSKTTKVFEKSTNALKRTLQVLAAITAATFTAGVKGTFSFQDALAEVSTLVDTTTFKMNKLAESAKVQAVAFGASPTAQVKSFYQIISAGASTAGEAISLLNVSNKLAVGGVTSVENAAGGLVSVLNAYGKEASEATDVSEAFFVEMKAGQTTVGELASNIGKVAPLAKSAGVSFDSLLAGVSALTKDGIDTTIAITGMKAILASIIKPTKEATDEAKRLGLQFNVSALQSKGLAGFLKELAEKTGGSTESIALLFGGLEALVPVLAFAGSAGESFNEILEQMQKKGGATEEAFNKMVNSPGFQSRRLFAALTVEILKLTEAFASKLVPVMKSAADNMASAFQFLKDNINLVLTLGKDLLTIGIGVKMIGYAVAFIKFARAAQFAGVALILFNSVQKATIVTALVLVAAVAKATGSLQALRDVVSTAFKNAKSLLPDDLTGAVGLLTKLGVNLSAFEDSVIGAKTKVVALFDAFGDPIKKAVASIPQDPFKPVRTSAEKTKKSVKKITEEIDSFNQDTFKGLFTDLSENLRQGQSLWKSLGNVAVSALNKIADKLIDMGSSGLFEGLFGAKGGAGGGNFLSTIVGGVSSFFGGGSSAIGTGGLFKNGAAFKNGSVTKFAAGGVVDRPTSFAMSGGRSGLMGEAGQPEAIMPLKRGANGQLGVQMQGGSNGPANVTVSNTYILDGAISSQTVQEQIAATAERTAQQVKSAIKQNLVPWLNEFDTNGALA